MWTIFLFVLGLAIGSFLHVLASRYDENRFLLTRDTLGGRSYCPACRKTLVWYELVPLLSFLVQRGRCRSCGAKMSWSYLIVELTAGLIVVCVSLSALAMGLVPLVAALWTAVFLILLLMTLIDMRLQIIPDELVVMLAVLGVGIVALGSPSADVWLNHFGAALGAALFFAALIAVTRGKGMGVGDAKLVFALGLIFGWPHTLLLVMLAFIVGAAIGVTLIAVRVKNLKSAVPFGPFLTLAAAATFFFAQNIIESWYNWMI